MGACDQIAVFHQQLVDRSHRQVRLEAAPNGAIVDRDVDPGLGPGVEESATGRVGADDAGEVVLGDAGVDPRPVLPVVAGDVEVGPVVVQLVAGAGHVGRAGLEGRRLDAADHGPLGQVGRRDLLPASAAIPADVQTAVVGASPEDTLLVGRLCKGEDRSVGFGADCVQVDGPARWLEGFGVGAGQVRADRLPALPLVGATEDAVAADVDGVRVVRRDDDRVGPGEALLVLARAEAAHRLRPGGDQADLVRAPIVALEGVSAARGGANCPNVDDIRVVGAHGDVAALARAGDKAVAPGDCGVPDLARHRDAGVVLLSAVDEVGDPVVSGEVVELGGRLVVDRAEGDAAVE